MSSQSLKISTLLFFCCLIAVAVIGFFYIRSQNSAQASRAFQSLVPQAELFSGTFRTMDAGLRGKTSQSIFGVLEANPLARMAVITDAKQELYLHWAAPVIGAPAVPSTQAPAYAIPKAEIGTALFETSLPDGVRLVAVFNLIPVEDVERLAFVILAMLGTWVVFLLVNLALASGEKVSISHPEPKAETDSGRDPAGPQFGPPGKPLPVWVSHKKSPEAANEAGEAKPVEESSETESKFILLDKKTGVTQERFLRFRLDKELERNAENALDVSIALFRFAGLAEVDYSKAAAMLLGEFSHEDLIFEYGKDSFCVVLPQHDLDQAIARAELVIRKNDRLDDTSNGKPFSLGVGLSSRNGRLIDAPRIIKEALTALEKTDSAEGRIVGFRPDPVRFRNFLKHQRV